MTSTKAVVLLPTTDASAPRVADAGCHWIVANDASEKVVYDLWDTLENDERLEFSMESDYRVSQHVTSGTRGYQNSFGFDERKKKLLNARAVFRSNKHGYRDGIEVDRYGHATGRVRIALPQQRGTTLQSDCAEMATTSMNCDENVTFHSVAWNMEECPRPWISTAHRIVENMRVVSVSETHYVLAPLERSRE